MWIQIPYSAIKTSTQDIALKNEVKLTALATLDVILDQESASNAIVKCAFLKYVRFHFFS